MTQITGAWLVKAETQMALSILTDAGYAAYLVGGAVRDALLERPVGDLDVATDALPEDVTRIFAAAGHKVIPTGADHGTVTAVLGGHPFEITTFRKDVETDGRRAVVAYSRNVSDDAHRRDFTMNALYARPDGTLIDPLGGLPDLRARRVLFIENAEDRIREDYLRILRFFRFHAWYGDPQAGIDPGGLAACAALSEGLQALSKERVGAEIRKLLGAPDPAPAVASMQAAGCLARVLPGADSRALPLLVDHEAATGVLPDPIRRLAVLGGHDHSDHLRLSRADTRRLEVILDGVQGIKGPAELAYRHGADPARDILMVRAALLETPLAPGIEAAIEDGAKATFPVTSGDLVSVVTGAALGKMLKELEAKWIASGFALTREDLLG